MTDIQTVVDETIGKLEAMLAKQPVTQPRSKVVEHLNRPRLATQQPVSGDPRPEVAEFPPPARWITYPKPVSAILMGATMGPMMSMAGVKEPIYFTVVAIEGNRVGVAYGLFKLPDVDQGDRA